MFNSNVSAALSLNDELPPLSEAKLAAPRPRRGLVRRPRLIDALDADTALTLVAAPAGYGKTTVVRAFFDQARSDSFEIIYIFTPQVGPLEMATHICRELDEPDPPSIFAAVPRLSWKLLDIFESGRTVVLMIDEAQLLPLETLEFLRLLSNFETDREKLIQIVLVGQPELDATLARRDMRQVNQRIALRARLAPLSLDESIEYIEHLLLASGSDDLTQILSPGAAWRIAEAADCIPRAINILADNALIAGFGAGQLRFEIVDLDAAEPTRANDDLAIVLMGDVLAIHLEMNVGDQIVARFDRAIFDGDQRSLLLAQVL